MKFLLEAGADPAIANDYDQLPMDVVGTHWHARRPNPHLPELRELLEVRAAAAAE